MKIKPFKHFGHRLVAFFKFDDDKQDKQMDDEFLGEFFWLKAYIRIFGSWSLQSTLLYPCKSGLAVITICPELEANCFDK